MGILDKAIANPVPLIPDPVGEKRIDLEIQTIAPRLTRGSFTDKTA
jgi:hypothetical protein